MGDTESGSWSSNQLLGFQRREEAREMARIDCSKPNVANVPQERRAPEARNWNINWHVCYDDARKELWRVALSIGPITANHDHWAGWYVADQETAEFVKAACEHYEAWLKVTQL